MGRMADEPGFDRSPRVRHVKPSSARLRAREVVLAVSIGAVAAGGAALVLLQNDDAGPAAAVETANRLSYDVAPFSNVATVGPQRVVIENGTSYAVRADGPAEVLGQLEAVVRNGVLTIQPKERFQRRGRWSRFDSATFHVTAPRLDSVSLAGSGEVSVTGVEGERFSGTVAGPGELSVTGLRVADADFTMAGSGELLAAGSADQARIAIAGSGEVSARGLTTQNAAVSIGGSGDAALTVNGDARISILGSGDVDIEGTTRCAVTRFGSGDVSCTDGTD